MSLDSVMDEALPMIGSWSNASVWIVTLKHRKWKLKHRWRLKRRNQKLKWRRRLNRRAEALQSEAESSRWRSDGFNGLMRAWESVRWWRSDVKKKELKCYIYTSSLVTILFRHCCMPLATKSGSSQIIKQMATV